MADYLVVSFRKTGWIIFDKQMYLPVCGYSAKLKVTESR